ncbi:MAG TPA: hypothetical protein VF131_00275 [Blastocatellia bacterium]|nr:hypothetical protein [Blastocatellia bacterium]
MSTRVRIIIDSGLFLLARSDDQPLDVGYFETSKATDITVYEDGTQILPPPDTKFERGKHIFHVQHLEAGNGVKTGVTLSPSFGKELLRLRELYGPDVPDVDRSQFDCTFRFYSGEFDTTDLRTRTFMEYGIGGGGPTGNDKPTRAIAHDVMVEYELGQDETLRIMRDDGKILWESPLGSSTARQFEVKLLADDSTITSYYDTALRHKSKYCWRPNPADPPPAGVP